MEIVGLKEEKLTTTITGLEMFRKSLEFAPVSYTHLAQLKTEYAELSPQHKPLREEVIRLRQVQNAVDTALRCV